MSNELRHAAIGVSALRKDAVDKVLGRAMYPGDLTAPDMLHMKMLFSERAHARVLEVDTAAAKKCRGVQLVLAAEDVPVNEYGLQIPDQPVLCGPGGEIPGSDIVRFFGDQIAAVVADTEEHAAAAIKLIRVTYADLPVLADPDSAMRDGAPVLHPARGATNAGIHYKIRKGDAESALRTAAVIVEGTYQTPVQEHAYLQPEAGLSYYDESGRLVIAAGGQWTDADRESIAHALGLEQDKVRVIYPAIGGAFGGREDLSVQIVLCLATMRLRKPVKIIWSRRESIIGHGKRHALVLKARWGASKDGKLVAAINEITADAGAYMYTSNKVLGNTTITSTGPYFIPAVKTDVYGVFTNNTPGAAFRGFGAPQAAFMAEGQMNKLAEKLGMDPVEFRLKNALRDGLTMGVGTPAPPPVTIAPVMEQAAQNANWVPQSGKSSNVPALGAAIGRGFGAGFKNVGFSFAYQENSWAKVELHGDKSVDKVIVHHAAAEVGQGTHTVISQMAAQAVGVDLSLIEFRASDSATQRNAGSASASRMTFMAGNAVKGAAAAALVKWRAEERPAIAEYVYLAPKTTHFDEETGYSTPNFAYAYAAHVVDVEVDVETGHVRLKRVVVADDVGHAINPMLAVGQVEGAIIQAQGYAITEDFRSKDGKVLTDQFSTYLIPTILDIPDAVDTVLVEIPDPNGPWGARGLGEIPFLSLAPAIAGAIHDATGVWIDQFPFTPERVLRALGKI